MAVLVDTSIWSLAFRRRQKTENALVARLEELITAGEAFIIGPIRQELLSGIKNRSQFNRLRKAMSAFPDIFIHTGDYELAAEMYNACRAKGIQGSTIDFLICAVSKRRSLSIFTDDSDFKRFRKVIDIRIFE